MEQAVRLLDILRRMVPHPEISLELPESFLLKTAAREEARRRRDLLCMYTQAELADIPIAERAAHEELLARIAAPSGNGGA